MKKLLSIAAIVLLCAISCLVVAKRIRPDSFAAVTAGERSGTPTAAAARNEDGNGDGNGQIPSDAVSEYAGKLVISEIMVKNKATLMSASAEFPDWLELFNPLGEAISLEGWSLSDDPADIGCALPAVSLAPGERILILASSQALSGASEYAAVNFSLSAGEELCLFGPDGLAAQRVSCIDTDSDISYAMDGDGSFYECMYPTPGRENTKEAFCRLCDEADTPAELAINEVMSFNREYLENDILGYSDWVELKNMSDHSLDISDYYLSAKSGDYLSCRLPSYTLKPAQTVTVLCVPAEDREGLNLAGVRTPMVELGLDSGNDRLFLSTESEIVDYVSLKGIPAGSSYGRVSGQNGFFYISEPTPGAENSAGYRYVSSMPESDTKSGVFEGEASLKISLSAEGTVYYTTDGSAPTVQSAVYTEPVSVSSTTVLRAAAKEENGTMSRPLTLNFIINEGHDLPVICVSTDDRETFEYMFNRGRKGIEIPGNVEYLNGTEGFYMDCGVTMAGRASLLNLKRHNMTFKFRGVYGQEVLDYPLFGDESELFHALTVRGGQDKIPEGIRTELFQNLCLEFSDSVISQRSSYCVVYVNGEYYGLYALKEKVNAANLAERDGVLKESVDIIDGPVAANTDLYKEVIGPCIKLDMSRDENYRYISSVLDIDSYIDWAVMEGYAANYDIEKGNMAYYRSDATGGRWRMIFYDLDSAWRLEYYHFNNVLNLGVQNEQMLVSLLKNPEFRQKFLTRAAEALNGTLADENVQQMIDRLCAQVIGESERDTRRWNGDSVYINRQAPIQTYLTDIDPREKSISVIDRILELTDEELELFGR